MTGGGGRNIPHREAGRVGRAAIRGRLGRHQGKCQDIANEERDDREGEEEHAGFFSQGFGPDNDWRGFDWDFTWIRSSVRLSLATSKEHGVCMDQRFERLSPRQIEILGRIADGLTNREIGEELGLTEKTVKSYVERLLETIGVPNRAAAAAAWAGRDRE